MHVVLLLVACLLLCGEVWAQTPAATTTPLPPKVVPTAAKPRWIDLNEDQKEALSPLQSQWDTFDAERKRKWLAMAARYPQLSPEGKQRFHERIPDYANLTPAQRETARSNFRKAYELPLEQRQSAVDQYKQLPEEKKQAMANNPKEQTAPPRRPERASRQDAKGVAPSSSASPPPSSR